MSGSGTGRRNFWPNPSPVIGDDRMVMLRSKFSILRYRSLLWSLALTWSGAITVLSACAGKPASDVEFQNAPISHDRGVNRMQVGHVPHL